MYYKIVPATEPRKIGNRYPQAEAIYNSNIEDPKYLHNISPRFSKVNQEVIVPMAGITKKSTKLTDLLSVTGYSFDLRLLISDKLKKILESSRQIGFQFFNTTVFDLKHFQNPYWLVSPYVFFPEYVDFARSDIWLVGSGGVKLEKVFCESFEEFERQKRIHAPVPLYIYKLRLNEQLIEYDFFTVNEVHGVISYFVSENLKSKIEESGCTGIDFYSVE